MSRGRNVQARNQSRFPIANQNARSSIEDDYVITSPSKKHNLSLFTNKKGYLVW